VTMGDAKRFIEKTVVVTGASRGIGFEIARAFAAEGASVVATARNRGGLDAAVARLSGVGGSVRGVVADASEATDVEAVLSEALEIRGRVDVLVNNAGAFTQTGVLELDKAGLHEAIDANLTPTLVSSGVIGRRMAEQKSGAIVNVASLGAHGADGAAAAYSAAKAGVLALTRALAFELGAYNVRCNSVSPAVVDTEKVDAYPVEFQRWLREDFTRSPLGRITTAGEVAAVCLFLASEETSALTGIDIKVDTGQSALLFVEASAPFGT
jgi:NAD(P)-dependent dehydrogenase (short-subunit alcohol dehydrogenase family)